MAVPSPKPQSLALETLEQWRFLLPESFRKTPRPGPHAQMLVERPIILTCSQGEPQLEACGVYAVLPPPFATESAESLRGIVTGPISHRARMRT